MSAPCRFENSDAYLGDTIYTNIKEDAEFGEDILNDGNVEQWIEQPVDWRAKNTNGGGKNSLSKTSDVEEGDFAVILASDGSDWAGLEYDVTGLTPTDTCRMGFNAKIEDGCNAIFHAYYVDTDIYRYNFTGDDAGTWTVNNSDPNSDQKHDILVGSAYDNYTCPEMVVPTGGAFTLAIWTEEKSIYIDYPSFGVAPLYGNILTNPTFTTWELAKDETNDNSNVLRYWYSKRFTTGVSDDTGEATLLADTTNESQGTYALSLQTVADVGGDQNIFACSYPISGLTPADTYEVQFNAMTSDSGTYGGVVFLNDLPSAATQVYDTVLGWVAWTRFYDMTGDTMQPFEAATSMTAVDSIQTTIPANGKICVCLASSVDESVYGTVVYDEIRLKKVLSVSPLAIVNVKNPTAIGDMEATDYWVKVMADDGSTVGFGVQKNGTVTAYGGLLNLGTIQSKVNITEVDGATYDLASADSILHVTRTGTGTCAIDLKTAQCVAGRRIVIKDAGGGAATYNITITTEGAETIDGQATYVITGNYNSVAIYSDGSNWFIE